MIRIANPKPAPGPDKGSGVDFVNGTSHLSRAGPITDTDPTTTATDSGQALRWLVKGLDAPSSRANSFTCRRAGRGLKVERASVVSQPN